MFKKLFYVVAYHFRNNEYARFAVTADTVADAEGEVKGSMSEEWRIERTLFIANTPDQLYLEL